MRHPSSLPFSIALPVGLAVGLASIAACGSGRDGFDNGTNGASSSGDPNSPPPGSLGNSTSSSSSGDSQTCAALTTSAKKAQVDIIVLIDTSGSMGEETNQVKTNINNFAASIGASGLDYQVIMIAEKYKPSPLPFIPAMGVCVPAPLGGTNCADNPPKFHHLDRVVASTDSLQILINDYAKYSGWLRPNAYKVFVEVTDDNSSLGWQQFDTQLLAKSAAQFGDTKSRKYIFDSICGWTKGSAVLAAKKCGSAVNIGDQYQNLSKLTGGIVDSVCETDYSGVFNNLAKGLVTKLGCEFGMPADQSGGMADPTAVVVKYTPGSGAPKQLTQVTDQSKCGTVAGAWYYDDNAKPTKIIFCPSVCTAAGADTSGKVEVLVGCKAPPPK